MKILLDENGKILTNNNGLIYTNDEPSSGGSSEIYIHHINASLYTYDDGSEEDLNDDIQFTIYTNFETPFESLESALEHIMPSSKNAIGGNDYNGDITCVVATPWSAPAVLSYIHYYEAEYDGIDTYIDIYYYTNDKRVSHGYIRSPMHDQRYSVTKFIDKVVKVSK